MQAARMRRWMLWGAPAAMLAAALGGHAGGAAGVFLWGLAGPLLPPRQRAPYLHARQARPARAFFASALGALCCLLLAQGAAALLNALAPASDNALFAHLAAVPPALCLGGEAAFFRKGRRACLAGGLLCCLLSGLLIAYR